MRLHLVEVFASIKLRLGLSVLQSELLEALELLSMSLIVACSPVTADSVHPFIW